MDDRNTSSNVRQTQSVTYPPALLFVLAAGVLMLMSAMEPSLTLPLLAFAAMAALTRLLGRRLYRDLAGTSRQVN